MKKIESKYSRIVIKVGSNVVTKDNGNLDTWRISRIVEDLSILYRRGAEVILVTSGAVAAGRSEVQPVKKNDPVSSRQVWAAVGQVRLMSSYQFLFGKFNIPAGQILTTKEGFRDRRHYLNMKNCISAMLENKVIPIVNENDAVAIDELMFTDNDELSGLIASMMDCSTLIILSNVDGVFTGDPSSKDAELIREIRDDQPEINKYVTSSRSASGRGGMITKYSNARRIASEGIDVFIANGNRDAIITDIINGKDVPYTHFVANREKEKSVKKWISHSETFAKGAVIINSGAREALLTCKASLLMIGITGVEGYFEKGDIVSILDENRINIGLGKAQYDSRKARQSIGEKLRKPFIHNDYLVINEKIRNRPEGTKKN